MIEGYDDVMREWSAPSIGHGCCNTVTIHPNDEMDRWAVQQVITVLANSDYYYTKSEVDYIIQHMHPGMTPEEVQEMIDRSIASKANQEDLEALSAQVQTNTEAILNTYTKPEVNALLQSYYTKIQTNAMFGNYSKVVDTTLLLNADNIS